MDPGPLATVDPSDSVEAAAAAPLTARGVRAFLVRSTALNYAMTAIVYAVGFFTAPYFLHTLGSDAYGISTLPQVFALAGWASLLELGIMIGVLRGVVAAAAREDWAGVSRLVSTALVVFGLIGIVACALLVSSSSFLSTSVFHVDPAYRSALTDAFRVVGLTLLLQFPLLAIVALVEGLQRVDVYLFTRFLGAVVSVGLALALVANGAGVFWFMVAYIVGPLAGTFALVGWWLRANHGLVQLSPRLVTRPALRTLRGLSGALFLTRVVEVVFTNTDRIVIGVALAATALTKYAIAYKLYAVVYTVAVLMQTAVIPAASHYAAGHDLPRLRELFLRGTKYAAVVSLPFAAVLLVLARPLISAWVGSRYDSAAVPLQVVLSHLFVSSLVGVGSLLLIAMNQVGVLVRLTLVSAAINLAISIATVHALGVTGVMLGTVVAYAIVTPPLVSRVLRALELTWRDLLRAVVLPVYPWVGLGALVAWVGLQLLDPRSLLAVVGLGALAAAISVGGILVFGLSPHERRQLLGEGRFGLAGLDA
jgi:O-antigen/teichoic acid export membrane protein